MRLLLLLKVASALTSGALPPSALYKPTETGDRAISWVAALGVFAKLVKRRPAAAVVAGVLARMRVAGAQAGGDLSRWFGRTCRRRARSGRAD